jgi:DNA-binding transcriptional MocR family regulator
MVWAKTVMNISLDKEDRTPLYRQIVRQIRDKILSGQLPSGYHLPPERKLAEDLSVTRATVKTAYDELKAQGLLDARVGRGTVVAAAKHPLPETAFRRSVVWSHYFRDDRLRPADPLVRDLLDVSLRPGAISLAVGLPSAEHVPLQLFEQTVGDLVHEAGSQILLQSPTEGHLPLRSAMSEWLSHRGIRSSTEEVMILSGSQQGVHLASRVFLNPGDIVIVEAPTYFGALGVFRRAGVHLISVPVDEHGMQVEVLATLLRHQRPKLIYVQPTFQNPSSSVLSLERRFHLLQLIASYGIPVLEDDTYSELRYEGDSLPSLKALDTSGLVMCLGTFSKILFPGIRLGWLIADREVIQQFALAKQTEDLHSGTLAQWVVERMIRDGSLDVHLAEMRHVYREHRDLMESALRAQHIDGLNWQTPAGGFYFWCEVKQNLDRARLTAAAADEAVNFLPGFACFADEPNGSFIRLSFSYTARHDISEGVARFARALRYSVVDRKPQRDYDPVTTRPLV